MKTRTLATLFLAMQGAAAQTVLTRSTLTEPPNQGQSSNPSPAVNYTNMPPAENATRSVAIEPLKLILSNVLDIDRATLTAPLVLTITSTYVTRIAVSSTAGSLFISKSSTPALSSWNNPASSSTDSSTQSSPSPKTVTVTDSQTIFTSEPSPTSSVLTVASITNEPLFFDGSTPMQAVTTTSSDIDQDSSYSSAGSDVDSQATATTTTVKTYLASTYQKSLASSYQTSHASTYQTSQILQSTSSVGNAPTNLGITSLSTTSVEDSSTSVSPSSTVSTVSTSSTSSSTATDLTSNLQSSSTAATASQYSQGVAVSVGGVRIGTLTPTSTSTSTESIQSTSTPLNSTTVTGPTSTPTPTLSSITSAPTTTITYGSTTIAYSITITGSVIHPTPGSPPVQPFTANVEISKDGKCGSQYTPWITCLGAQFGACCSIQGECGNDEEHCRPTNCAVYFGYCGPAWIGKPAPRLESPERRRMAREWRRLRWERWDRE